jgi:hypothetical protein
MTPGCDEALEWLSIHAMPAEAFILFARSRENR